MNILAHLPMIKLSKSKQTKPKEMADFIIEEILSKEIEEIIESK